MINALAFLPLNEVSSGMDYLYTIIPIELLPVAKYFDDIYVSGTSGTSMFSPILWNIFDVTLNGDIFQYITPIFRLFHLFCSKHSNRTNFPFTKLNDSCERL
jgi:hypothetical protein